MVTSIEIRNQIERTILAIPGVTGVGLGHNSPDTIRIYLKSQCPKITCNIPESIGGVPVKQIVTGKIEALTLLEPPVSRRDRFRPAPGGVSIGHFLTGAGTFGILCYDATTGEKLILSNNHVLANESSIQNSRARAGDLVLQPGVSDDANIIANGIGELVRWIDMDEIGDINANEVDCAVARPTNPEDITDEILEIGRVTEIGEAVIGDEVMKSGRSTGLLSGKVEDVNATIKIDYGYFKGAAFRNQIVITPSIAVGGDSGSAIIRKSDNKCVGLLVAGSERITVANRMSIVAQRMNINLGAPAPLPSQEPQGSGWGTVTALGAMSLPFLLFMNRSKDKRRYNG